MESEHYDIAATMPPATTDAEVLLMFQSLLEERLLLKLHREQKETDIYALIAGKGGPKFKPTSEGTAQDVRFRGPARVECKNKSMNDLAGILSLRTDRPVIDMTELKGSYDFDLDGGLDRGDPMAVLDALPALGLKVVKQRAKLEYLFVEHAEKTPVEN